MHYASTPNPSWPIKHPTKMAATTTSALPKTPWRVQSLTKSEAAGEKIQTTVYVVWALGKKISFSFLFYCTNMCLPSESDMLRFKLCPRPTTPPPSPPQRITTSTNGLPRHYVTPAAIKRLERHLEHLDTAGKGDGMVATTKTGPN